MVVVRSNNPETTISGLNLVHSAMTPKSQGAHPAREKLHRLFCGSIMSHDNDDLILRTMYEMLDLYETNSQDIPVLKLRFHDRLETLEDFEIALKARIESIFYRNFFDWDCKLYSCGNLCYVFHTQGINLLMTGMRSSSSHIMDRSQCELTIRPIQIRSLQ